MKKLLLFNLLFTFIFSVYGQNYAPGEIALALKKLNTAGSVLYIAAHPDDENTRLIAWLANEKCLRTGYLSLTRGDGGQNLIGKEQGDLLGLTRTQELLAARSTDGGEQFFTRAIDFGYSKNPEETFAIWGKDSILKDVMYTIRKFQPDVIICRFGTDGSGGHGHHTASALLAEEAFDMAGDPTKFPELNALVKPWKPKLLTWNFWIDRSKMTGKTVRVDVGTFNNLLGKSYGEIASESRSMHKSQGFGVAKNRGEVFEHFKILKGDCDTNNLFSGVDLSLKRLAGSGEFEKAVQKAEKAYDFRQPARILPHLIKALQACDAITDEHWRNRKKWELNRLIRSCLGLYAEATTDDYFTTPGGKLRTSFSIINRSAEPISILKMRVGAIYDTALTVQLKNNVPLKTTTWLKIPDNQLFTNPYWLDKKPVSQGLARIENPRQIGWPQNEPAFEAVFELIVQGQPITVAVPVQYKWVEPADGEKFRSLEVLPPATVNMEEKAYVFTSPEFKVINLRLTAHRPATSGVLSVRVPEGWEVQPNEIPFSLVKKGEEQSIDIKVRALAGAKTENLELKLQTESGSYNKSLVRVNYPHIPIQTLLYPAEAKLVPVDLKKTGARIGYINGAGDGVAAGLRQAGYQVDELDEKTIMTGNLGVYQAIVTGVRLYNVNDRTAAWQPRLMDYVKNGGNLVVQYNTNNWISSVKVNMGPFPFTISRERVTKEEAAVTFLLPEHPMFKAPNVLTSKDFDEWVQERGIYFATEFGPEYQCPIAMNDPGEKEQKGSLIIAAHGKGNFVYTGLSLFRQIPAGVPGAFRLLANIMALPPH